MKRSNAIKQLDVSRAAGAAMILDYSHIPPDPVLMRDALNAQAGDERAKERVINATSRMVYMEARRIWLLWCAVLPNSAQFDDVFQAGIEGVLHALKKYDPHQDTKFSTYAMPWIRTKSQRALYGMLGHARIPENVIRGVLPPDSFLYARNHCSVNPDGDDDLNVETRATDFSTPMASELLSSIAAEDPRFAVIARLRLEGFSDPEIGDQLGLSSQRIRDLGKELRDAAEAAMV